MSLSQQAAIAYTFEIASVPIIRSEDRIAVVDISTTLTYKAGIASSDYPDIRLIVSEVRDSVRRPAPGRKVYFEVIAKEAAAKVLAAYPAITMVTIALNIHANETRSYKGLIRATLSR